MNKPKSLEQPQKPVLEESCVYKGPLNKVVDTAKHYGFCLFEPLTITSRLPSTLTRAKKNLLKERDFSGFPKDYMSTLKKYIDEEMHKFSQPIMICHIVNKDKDLSELRLEVIGTKKSVAEATVIKTASIILGDLGYKNTRVRLNCLGDRESGNNFIKELTNYYRNHIENLSPTLQELLKKDILRVYENRSEKYREINENAPKPVAFLSEESREHFGQVIEFLENLRMDYEINDSLVGGSTCAPKTLFEILEDGENGAVLAKGERYDYLAQSIGFNKKVPIVGIGINIKRKNRTKDLYRPKTQNSLDPKIYFIHLGFEAKKKSLSILETFRKSRIPVYQSLCHDSFSLQLKKAYIAGTPYAIIMGQKEVIDNSVIWRDMETRYQENINIQDLEHFLNNLRKKKII